MHRVRFLFYGLLLFGTGAELSGQISGSIRGQVAAEDGSPLPEARVTLSGDPLSGAPRTFVTGPSGSFLFTSLPVGTYRLTAERDGFEGQVLESVRVSVSATSSATFRLSPEPVVEELTVRSATGLIDVYNSVAGTTLDRQLLEEMPTRRQFFDLVALSPGITYPEEQFTNFTAHGSNSQSSTWNVDGMNIDIPEAGDLSLRLNPDTVEEIRVLGIGAQAEYGNMLGATINVVTKSGGNRFSGSTNLYYQSQQLTSASVSLEDSPYPEFERDQYLDATLTLGGPIRRDRAWYFVAAEHFEDGFSQPGINPLFPRTEDAERYNLKLTFQLAASHRLDVPVYFDEALRVPQPSPFQELSATGELGTENRGWGLNYSGILGPNTMIDVRLGSWKLDAFWRSLTGSTETAFLDLAPEGGGPPRWSGGLVGPWEWDPERQQANAQLSHFAADWLGDHDFKFGVEYTEGSGNTLLALSATGDFIIRGEAGGDEFFLNQQLDYPFLYGAEQSTLSAYADDSWHIDERWTVNLGLRFDHHEGRIPDYPRLNRDFEPTGEIIPGRDVIDWDNLAPRLGFAFQPTASGRTVVRGSVGLYYDDNISGNWDSPPPERPPIETWLYDPQSRENLAFLSAATVEEVPVDPDLRTPRSLIYSLGFEHQLAQDYSLGARALYKKTDDLVGWEILGDGEYEPFLYTDFESGEEILLANIIEPPTRRKGNRPGDGSLAGPEAEYEQRYRALVLTFERRHREGWGLLASYTLSDSEGLIQRRDPQPRNGQGRALFGGTLGSDPNHTLNAYRTLDGDRRHMLRVLATLDLPWRLRFSGVLNAQEGRPFDRMGRANLNQGPTEFIVVPANDDKRLPSQIIVDVGLSRPFALGSSVELELGIQVLNLLNDDANQFWETLVLEPGDELVARDWLIPRRAVLRASLRF